jgi:hypothetical protein
MPVSIYSSPFSAIPPLYRTFFLMSIWFEMLLIAFFSFFWYA